MRIIYYQPSVGTFSFEEGMVVVGQVSPRRVDQFTALVGNLLFLVLPVPIFRSLFSESTLRYGFYNLIVLGISSSFVTKRNSDERTGFPECDL